MDSGDESAKHCDWIDRMGYGDRENSLYIRISYPKKKTDCRCKIVQVIKSLSETDTRRSVTDHTASVAVYKNKRLIEKSRECHNDKPQPTPDTKRKRKRTKTNTCKTNAREAHRPAPSSPSEVIAMLTGMKKHEDKEERQYFKT